MITDMIIAIVTTLVIGALIGVPIGLYLGGWLFSEEQDENEQTRILTVGASVMYHGSEWVILRFMTDSDNQVIAEIEQDGEEPIRKRATMAAVEELEAVPE